MMEKGRVFESAFHKQYVGGEGVVVNKPINSSSELGEPKKSTTYEDVLAEYRWYVRDPKAELPLNIKKIFLAINRTENDRE